MADPVIEREREVGGRIGLAERLHGTLRDFREVHLPALLEQHLEHRDRDGQQCRQRFDDLPLSVGIARRRQLAGEVQLLDEGAVRCDLPCQRLERFLRILAPLALRALRARRGGEALPRGYAPPQSACLRQQQLGNAAPGIEVARLGAGDGFHAVAGGDGRSLPFRREIAGGVARGLDEFHARFRRQQRRKACERVARSVGQRLLERLAFLAARAGHRPQPLVAHLEHVRDQLLRALDVVVEVPQHGCDVKRPRLLRVEPGERAARRLGVERVRVVQRLGLRAEAGGERQLAREPVAERIDGLDAQPVGVFGDAPAGGAVTGARGARELPGGALVRCPGRGAVLRAGERLQHAHSHLRRRLLREGDGDDLLGRIHAREQCEVTLDQQLGLARARRRLDDKGAGGVERLAPRLLVLRAERFEIGVFRCLVHGRIFRRALRPPSPLVGEGWGEGFWSESAIR